MLKTRRQYHFGEKIHLVRERRRVTLREVALAAGVSESLVSQIERNKVSPSIDTLLSIADVLEIDLEYLFKDHKQNKLLTITHSDDTDLLSLDNVIYRHLSSIDNKNVKIEALSIEIEPGGEKGKIEYGHPGFEIGIITGGSCEILYGTEQYLLKEGDSVSFSSDIPHILKNNGKTVLRAIWIITPPRIFT